MAQAMVIQGRKIMDGEIALIRDLIAQHRDWGRTHNDRDRRIQVPVKDVYLYPLIPHFRRSYSHSAPRQSRRSQSRLDAIVSSLYSPSGIG